MDNDYEMFQRALALYSIYLTVNAPSSAVAAFRVDRKRRAPIEESSMVKIDSLSR